MEGKGMRKTIRTITAISVALLWGAGAFAAEKPIGLPQEKAGMEIAAVYLQPIEMEPSTGPHAMRLRKDSDIHIEADIKALAGNPNGFGAGEWVPNHSRILTFVKLDEMVIHAALLLPRGASDGPHYGDN